MGISGLVADACVKVMPEKMKNFDVDSVRVTKIQGGNLNGSFVVDGMAIAKHTSGVETFKEKAKVAVFAGGIELTSTETKGTVLLNNAEELMNFTKGEEARMEKSIGVDVDASTLICDATEREILDHAETKRWALRFTLDAVLTVLQVDQIIMSKQAGGPKAPEGGGRDDD